MKFFLQQTYMVPFFAFLFIEFFYPCPVSLFLFPGYQSYSYDFSITHHTDGLRHWLKRQTVKLRYTCVFSILPGECGKCKIFPDDFNGATLICEDTFNGKPLSITAKVKYCDAKIEIDVRIMGKYFSRVVETDVDIPLSGLTELLVLNVKLHRKQDTLTLKVS